MPKWSRCRPPSIRSGTLTRTIRLRDRSYRRRGDSRALIQTTISARTRPRVPHDTKLGKHASRKVTRIAKAPAKRCRAVQGLPEQAPAVCVLTLLDADIASRAKPETR